MSIDINREVLEETLRKSFKTKKFNSFSTSITKKRKDHFISELKKFKLEYARSNDDDGVVSSIIEICKNVTNNVFLLKIFAERKPVISDTQDRCSNLIVLFNKIYSIIRNSPHLTSEEKLECINFQWLLMRLYSKILVGKME